MSFFRLPSRELYPLYERNLMIPFDLFLFEETQSFLLKIGRGWAE